MLDIDYWQVSNFTVCNNSIDIHNITYAYNNISNKCDINNDYNIKPKLCTHLY